MASSSQDRVTRSLLAGGVLLVCVSSFLAYTNRAAHPVLYYYGASPEVPQGTHIAFLNPFRNRQDEGTADFLIRDLRTEECEKITRERLRADPAQICPILRRSNTASLIWLDKEPSSGAPRGSRVLIYDLPEQKARLLVYFGTDEVGWIESTVSVLR
jgi:hypothetical protein